MWSLSTSTPTMLTSASRSQDIGLTVPTPPPPSNSQPGQKNKAENRNKAAVFVLCCHGDCSQCRGRSAGQTRGLTANIAGDQAGHSPHNWRENVPIAALDIVIDNMHVVGYNYYFKL